MDQSKIEEIAENLLLSPTQRITLTHIEFPHALWRNPSGACAFPFHGTSVQPSGSPMSVSDSPGTSRRSCVGVQTAFTCPARSVYIAAPASS